jgi:hypothetical protein
LWRKGTHVGRSIGKSGPLSTRVKGYGHFAVLPVRCVLRGSAVAPRQILHQARRCSTWNNCASGRPSRTSFPICSTWNIHTQAGAHLTLQPVPSVNPPKTCRPDANSGRTTAPPPPFSFCRSRRTRPSRSTIPCGPSSTTLRRGTGGTRLARNRVQPSSLPIAERNAW